MANTSSSLVEGMPHQHGKAELGARYTMVAAKNRWEEQGFYLDDSQVNYGLEPIIYRRLHEFVWFRLARRVAANAATINEILASQTMTLAYMPCSVYLKMKITSKSRTSSAKKTRRGTQRAETHILSAAPVFGQRLNYGILSSKER
ncbi:hypothetical protein V6N12_031991 [Hibiscus sabdariffa]|uniref:Uncharacterized protein n=1 Tax=Hibiscus sabdariffa TaxID=183260 RepID=A0ABR2BYR7_9ROSI